MITFCVSSLLLVVAYFVYGAYLDRTLGIDRTRQVPAIENQDGVDYIPMPWPRVFLIQLLNIAGLGPIFGAIAGALNADRLLFLTDVPGVMDKEGQIIPSLTISQAQMLIRDGTISGGMIPKIEGCIEVVEAGVEAVVIINGKVPHSVLLELLTDHGAGTLITR